VYLSARCPVFIAPAMDLDMWEHPATQNNIRLLTNYKNHIIPVEHGELASGLVGNGRMAEPENILTFLHQYFSNEYISKDLTGKKVLITSGPTYEPIDPVRFIGNRSSGKMGIAIADEMAKRGAEVTVVSGPSRILPQEKSVKIIKVESAQNMYETSQVLFPDVDIAVLAAAVADYTPSQVANQKIKKQGDELTIELKKTPDIAKELGAIKKNNQFIIGFALETNNEFSNAKEKLEKKNFDFIVLNSLQDAGAGFHHDTNKITIIDKTETLKYDLKTKAEVAKDITDLLVSRLKHKLI
jgi:phosphopantothenoylcysteine decarboxylase/phosphopantothenate--cysteine ligase